MPSCQHILTRGPNQGKPCDNNSEQQFCYLHRNLKQPLEEFKCEGENCDKMTSSLTRRCNNHHLKGIKLVQFKEENKIPLTNSDRISKIGEFLKENEKKIDAVYNLLFS
jgi:hypothetical protein